MWIVLLMSEFLLLATDGEDGISDGPVAGQFEIGKVTEDEKGGRWNRHCLCALFFVGRWCNIVIK